MTRKMFKQECAQYSVQPWTRNHLCAGDLRGLLMVARWKPWPGSQPAVALARGAERGFPHRVGRAGLHPYRAQCGDRMRAGRADSTACW